MSDDQFDFDVFISYSHDDEKWVTETLLPRLYVLQGADVHLELARLALARGDKRAAREHAEEARRLATCDGPPDYTYAAAYAESAALLAQL